MVTIVYMPYLLYTMVNHITQHGASNNTTVDHGTNCVCVCVCVCTKVNYGIPLSIVAYHGTPR